MWRNIFLLFPISAFAQLGMKIPAEYDGGEYINPETWWSTILTIIIIFIGPYLITRKIDDFDSSVYFRWFFVFFAGFLISIIIIPLVANKNDFSFWIIAIQVGIAFYGLITQKDEIIKKDVPQAIINSKDDQLESTIVVKPSGASNQARPNGKIWSVVGSHIYNKLTEKLYSYNVLKSGLAVSVIGNALEKNIGMVNISSIDIIKFNKGIANVECPNCGISNEVIQADELLISCSVCKFSWKQDMKIRD